MNRTAILKDIENNIGYSTGIIFHNKVTTCLKIYYKNKNILTKKTKQLGGDKGVDFFLPDEDTYFAISGSSDTSLKNTLDKLEHDLFTMTKNVIEKKLYTGKIKHFILVMNTFSEELPNDPSRKIEKLFEEYFEKYYPFEYDIWNVESIKDMLDQECANDVLVKISEELDMYSSTLSPTILDEIRDVLNQVEDTEEIKQSFKRKSTQQKIYENNLVIQEAQIESCLLNEWYSKFETVICDIEYNKKFNLFKDAVVKIYDENKKQYSHSELFENIIETVRVRYSCSHKVTYIFDRCDIF